MNVLKKFWENLKRLLKEMWDTNLEYYEVFNDLEYYQELGDDWYG